MKAKPIVEIRIQHAIEVCEQEVKELMKDYRNNRKEIIKVRREKQLYQSFLIRLNKFDGNTSRSQT